MNRTMIFSPDDGLSNISLEVGTLADNPKTAFITIMTGRGVVARLVVDRTTGRTNHFMMTEDTKSNDQTEGPKISKRSEPYVSKGAHEPSNNVSN